MLALDAEFGNVVHSGVKHTVAPDLVDLFGSEFGSRNDEELRYGNSEYEGLRMGHSKLVTPLGKQQWK